MTPREMPEEKTDETTRAPTVALVLETNNLEGGGASDDQVCESLLRLLRHLGGQTRPLGTLDEVVITHDRLGPAHAARLAAAAGRDVRLVRVARDAGYYQAKNAGFDATTAAIVVFADADCWPEPAWLERLVAPIAGTGAGTGASAGTEAAARAAVVAGRTTYRGDLLGVAATAIDFMYFPSPLGPGCTRNFYANNVAFRREIFAAHRYGAMDGVYRGHCQALGLRLQAAGVPVVFAPGARTRHRFPDSARDFLTLRLRRGQDTVGLVPHLASAYLPPRLRVLGRVRSLALLVLAIRLGHSLRAVGRQDMPPVRGLRAFACRALIAGLSLIDAAGALSRCFARRSAVLVDGDRRRADAVALSYHLDRDAPGGAPAAPAAAFPPPILAPRASRLGSRLVAVATTGAIIAAAGAAAFQVRAAAGTGGAAAAVAATVVAAPARTEAPAGAGIRRIAGRGVTYLDTTQRCPLAGVGARGANACLRIALDDGDSTVEVDAAAHRITWRNSRAYTGKQVVGDVLIVGTGRAPWGKPVPVAVHLLIRKRGHGFDAKPHAHSVIHERVGDVEIDGYDVVLVDGKREVHALTPASGREVIANPGLAARLANELVEVTDNLAAAGAAPRAGAADGRVADVTVGIGIGKAAKDVARAQLSIGAGARPAGVAALLSSGTWEVRFESLSRLIPRDVVARDLFLYGLEDLPLVADLKKDGLGKGKAIVFSMRDGKGSLEVGGASAELPNAADHARAFLEFSFLGAILEEQAASALTH